MKKYRLGYQIYLFALVIFLLLLPISLSPKFEGIWYVFCVPLIILNCIFLINAIFFTYKSIDDRGILLKNLFSNNFIEWGEISGVYDKREIYTAKSYIIKYLFKYMVSIHGKYKKIMITNWTKDSKELIKIVIDECKKRDIEVDLMVEKMTV